MIEKLPEGTIGSYQAYLARVFADDREAVEQAWQSFLERGGSFEHEHRIMVGNAIRYVRQRADLAFGADGRALRSLGTTQDITERRQVE